MSTADLTVYLAARYSRREELCGYREQLQAAGLTVQAQWLDGDHQITDGQLLAEKSLTCNRCDGSGSSVGIGAFKDIHRCPDCNGTGTISGEQAVEGAGGDDRAVELRAKFAADDWRDVHAADVVVSFTEPPRSTSSRGGRHVEFGAALALGKRCLIVGPRENVFHCLPTVELYESWDSAWPTLVSHFVSAVARRPRAATSEDIKPYSIPAGTGGG